MLYLFWALLNVALSIFFIAICFRATKLVREKFGLFTSLVFVLGLLSFMGNSNNNNRQTNSGQLKIWSLPSNDSSNKNATFSSFIVLEKTWISQYEVMVGFHKDEKEQLFTPVDAYFSTSGLISGTTWKPLRIEVNKTKNDNEFEYFVTVTVEWKLLGFSIYSQQKDYSGIIKPKMFL